MAKASIKGTNYSTGSKSAYLKVGNKPTTPDGINSPAGAMKAGGQKANSKKIVQRSAGSLSGSSSTGRKSGYAAVQ